MLNKTLKLVMSSEAGYERKRPILRLSQLTGSGEILQPTADHTQALRSITDNYLPRWRYHNDNIHSLPTYVLSQRPSLMSFAMVQHLGRTRSSRSRIPVWSLNVYFSYWQPHAHTGNRIPPYTHHQPTLPVLMPRAQQNYTITEHHRSMQPCRYFINPTVTEFNNLQSRNYGFISFPLGMFLHCC